MNSGNGGNRNRDDCDKNVDFGIDGDDEYVSNGGGGNGGDGFAEWLPFDPQNKEPYLPTICQNSIFLN